MTPDDITNEHAICILACAALINQHLYQLMDLQNLQTRVLKRLVAEKTTNLTNYERRQLARLAQDIERKVLERMETIVTVDSFRRWYRTLIANTYTPKHRGRPPHSKATKKLVIQMALDNPTWGHQTIADRATELGHTICKRAVGAILRKAGIPPAPERQKLTDMPKFIEAHWPGLIAIDCATWEVPQEIGNKTIRHHALYAIRVATREVKLLGVTDQADGEWATQCCRNLTAFEDDFMDRATAVIMDKDPIFIEAAKECFRSIGCDIKISRYPQANAYIERFIGTTRRDLKRSIIPFSTEALRHNLAVHVDYYNHHRTHQALPGHRMPVPRRERFTADDGGDIVRHDLLGKTLSYYERKAA